MVLSHWWMGQKQCLLWLRAQCRSDSLYSTAHSRMFRLACLSRTGTLCRPFFPTAFWVRVSSYEERPFWTFFLQAHLSHASTSQVSNVDGQSFRSCLPMSLKCCCVSQRAPLQLPVLHREGPWGYGSPPYRRHGLASAVVSAWVWCTWRWFLPSPALCCWVLFSPGDAQDVPQAVHVEGVESSFLPQTQGPWLTAVK